MLESKNWSKFLIEFISVFIAVVFAFALNNWNDSRRDYNTEKKILYEISNGLTKDLDDIVTFPKLGQLLSKKNPFK